VIRRFNWSRANVLHEPVFQSCITDKVLSCKLAFKLVILDYVT